MSERQREIQFSDHLGAARGPNWTLFQALTRYFVGAKVIARQRSLEGLVTCLVIICVCALRNIEYSLQTKSSPNLRSKLRNQKVTHPTNAAANILPQITPTDKHNRRSLRSFFPPVLRSPPSSLVTDTNIGGQSFGNSTFTLKQT